MEILYFNNLRQRGLFLPFIYEINPPSQPLFSLHTAPGKKAAPSKMRYLKLHFSQVVLQQL